MTRAVAFGVLLVCAWSSPGSWGVASAGPAPARQQRADPLGADLVLLDVVVLDRDGKPVTDLRQSDFQVIEDERSVDIQTFTAVSATGSSAPRDGRTMVLLLDTAGVQPGGTLTIQTIARALLSQTRAGDDVTVVRLGRRSDEPYGDLRVAVDRVTDYVAGSMPFVAGEIQETALRTIASLSAQMDDTDPRRKAIVCIGSMAVCNPIEPRPTTARRSLLEDWHSAVAATARANVGVFAVVPSTLSAREAGIVEFTGGAIYAGSGVVRSSVEGVWREVSGYYLLGYWSSAASEELRSVKVEVARKGLRVRARRAR
jgi:VWFA-related protein